MKKILLLLLITYCVMGSSRAQNQILPLWPKTKIANEDTIIHRDIGRWITYVATPTIEVFLPSKTNANQKAFLICPGGGYRGLAYDWEGTAVAKWLNSKGIAGIVLKSRLPDRTIEGEKRHAVAFTDACRAMKLVRHHAKSWNIDPNQIGILGFSAGGHLAATVAVHADAPNAIEIPTVDDQIQKLKGKPNFVTLIYPVISMDTSITHMGSRNSLLGQEISEALVKYYSTELNIDETTPPTLLIHASDDKAVVVNNSLEFYQNLVKHNVYSEMHIYPKGGHGFGLGLNFEHVQTWPQRLAEWLESIK